MERWRKAKGRGCQQESQASSSAAPPSPVEMDPALGGAKPSGDASKAPWGGASYRQKFVQALVTAWWPMNWTWGAWGKPGAKQLQPTHRNALLKGCDLVMRHLLSDGDVHVGHVAKEIDDAAAGRGQLGLGVQHRHQEAAGRTVSPWSPHQGFPHTVWFWWHGDDKLSLKSAG